MTWWDWSFISLGNWSDECRLECDGEDDDDDADEEEDDDDDDDTDGPWGGVTGGDLIRGFCLGCRTCFVAATLA